MLRSATAWTLIALLIFAPAATASDNRFDFTRYFRNKAPKDSAVVQLARTLDDLEKKLNQDGTVVAKAPDIWGEARLTKHRQEFERVMARDVDNFEFRLNAAVARSDQAFLANALAISALGGGISAADQAPTLNVSQAASLLPSLTQQSSSGGQPAAVQQPTNSVVTQTTPGGLIASDFKVSDPSISLEPALLLDQKARYLNHLHEIRRLNEGDDTSDSPGYSLNLVRVPVSIMPGSRTRQNHGAEVTLTATPHVTEELLPSTFRELVINDLIDVLAPVIRKLAEEIPSLDEPLETQNNGQFLPLAEVLLRPQAGDLVRNYYGEFGYANQLAGTAQYGGGSFRLGAGGSTQPFGIQRDVMPLDVGQVREQRDAGLLRTLSENPEVIGMATAELGQTIYSLAPQILSTGVGSVSRRSREPLSSSQLIYAFGVHELIGISYDIRQRSTPGQPVHLSDVRAYLHEELEAAYDLVSVPGHLAGRWLSDPMYVLDGLSPAHGIGTRLRDHSHQNIRSLFNDRVAITNQYSRLLQVKTLQQDLDLHVPSVTTSLAWAVVVESVLLNQRLNEDIRRVSRDPGCQCRCAGDLVFCGPNPDPQARQAFAEYVKCRWPVHVFALDPQAQDQNVADSFSMRREMQLALALAFAGGRISAQNMTRYVRRLELDMETIALNRTAAAFGHGKDVFGWRFYPRVQTPPFEGNSKTLFRDLLGGGPDKDDLRRSWEIEPGVRECTAVVLMPSFITHLTLDVRGNYFPLSQHGLKNPSDTRTSIEDTMEMSHKIRLMQDATCSIAAEAGLYRDGEVERLIRRVDQISKKLPLQTVHARVPNENTLGGFEMFSSGITDLAPELLDFYGLPGVHAGKDTILFLVGNNFSVHDTTVLAGNREVDFSLISRQVMRVTIPADVATMDRFQCAQRTRCEDSQHVVDVHIATPYGVSQHLEIPVIDDSVQVVPGYRWTRPGLSVAYHVPVTGTGDSEALNASAATSFMAPPFVLEVAVPPGNFNHAATAALTFVISSPQLGLSARVRSGTEFTANFDRVTSVYRIDAQNFVAVQDQVRSAFIEMVNAQLKGPKASGLFRVDVQATITPSSSAPAIPLDNALTIDVNLEVVKP